MKRGMILGVLVAVGTLTAAVGAVPQPQLRVVTVDRLKDNLYLLGGTDSGGNTAVFVGANSVTVVDTKNPGWGQPLIEAIRKITDKPITTIINTHSHFDHVSGNVEFPAHVEIVAHANAAANMPAMRTATGMPPPPANVFKEHGGHGLPERTFTDRLTLGSGSEQIDLYYFGRGHTNGDTFVVFPALRVMHAGDIFASKNLVLLDANNGGSGVAIGDTLAKAAAVKNVDTIIPGHSTVMTMPDLAQYAEFNREFLAAVQAGKKAGQTVEQIATAWKMPAKYQGYAQADPVRVLNNVRVTYDEIR